MSVLPQLLAAPPTGAHLSWLPVVNRAQRQVSQALHLAKASPEAVAFCLADLLETLLMRAARVIDEGLPSQALGDTREVLMLAHLQDALLHWLQENKQLPLPSARRAQAFLAQRFSSSDPASA